MSSAEAWPAASASSRPAVRETARSFIVGPPKCSLFEFWSVVVEHRPAAIDDDRFGVDERRFVRSQEQRRHGDFLGPADALWRMQLVRPPLFGFGIGEGVPIGGRDGCLDI